MARHRLLLLCLPLCLLLSTGAARAQEAGNAPLTRAGAAAILLKLRVSALPVIENTNRFPDVPEGRKYERSLLAAERYGILAADAKGFLRPDDPVTRASFLKMTTLTFGLTTHQPYYYEDVSAASWIDSYAGIASRYNLFTIEGTNPLLQPSLLLTQAEAKRILQALLDARVLKRAPASPFVAQDQATYQLQVYEKISSQSEEFSRVEPGTMGLTVPDEHPTPAQPSRAELKQRVLALVNQERLKKNLPPLHLDTYLNDSAQRYADDMATQNFFGHVSPQGEKLRDRMRRSGYYNPSYLESCLCIRTFQVGENLARGQKTPEEAVSDWLKSPTHRALILSKAFTETGIGINAGIWVQHFGGVKFTDEE